MYYCTNCGEKSNKKICNHCGVKNNRVHNYCSWCGEKLNEHASMCPNCKETVKSGCLPTVASVLAIPWFILNAILVLGFAFIEHELQLAMMYFIVAIVSIPFAGRFIKKKTHSNRMKKLIRPGVTLLRIILAVSLFFVATVIVMPEQNEIAGDNTRAGFESRYNSAVKLLENGQYEEAIVVFQDMKGYRDSDAKFDELLALIDFSDGKEIKLSNDYTMRRFMSGRWEEVSKGQYYFEVCEKEEGGCTIEYNLPHPESIGKYYFEDGVVWFGDKTSPSPGTKSFKISITGKDTVSIYCYKNDKTYELCRVEYAGQQEAKLACEAVDKIFAEAVNPNGSNEPTKNSSSGNGHTCEECGNNAMNTYKNPFSGKTEYYCNSHYQEILDIMSGFENDVGNSAQSKHTCEQCSREGTHRYNSFTGQTEYYCTQHYEELMDMLEAFGLD